MAGRIEEDIYYAGRVQFANLVPSAGSVSNLHVASGAGITEDKLQHQHRVAYAQPNTAATTETKPLYRCYGATGSVLAVHVGSIAVAVGAATVTVDVKKNGTTILTGVVTLNSSNTARVGVAGTVATTALAVGDLLEVVVTATAGGGTLPTGVFVEVRVAEDAS